MMLSLRSVLAVLALAALAMPDRALAQWVTDGAPVCTAAGDQGNVALLEDGNGGAVISWTDKRNGNDFDLYAQHILDSGAADPAWPADGLPLCTASGIQGGVCLVSDGAGGAIIAWYDKRNGSDWNVYAQHVVLSGIVDPAWPADGQALCTAAGDQITPTI